MQINSDMSTDRDCMNSESYGEICVSCGCCSRNSNYRNRTIRRIRYYRDRMKEIENFQEWSENPSLRGREKKNVRQNILYCQRKFRLYKKILKTL